MRQLYLLFNTGAVFLGIPKLSVCTIDHNPGSTPEPYKCSDLHARSRVHPSVLFQLMKKERFH